MSLCDDALVEVIRDRLCGDVRISALAIDICSDGGCVSLHGCVDTPEQRRLITDIITGVCGVRDVCCDDVRVRSAECECQ
jgi:osmotically-inducible protein OsmY